MANAKHLYIDPGFNLAGSGAATNFSMDAATDQLEFIIQAEEAGSVTKLAYRYGARTGTPPTYKISLQGVTDGLPDGTIKGGGTPASVTFTPPADASIDGLWQEQALANAYTCSRGELLAVVIAYDSGTVDGSNFSSFTQTDGFSLNSSIEGFPYVISNNAGVRTRQAARPVFGYLMGATVFGNPNQAAFASAAFTSATTPDEIATRFIIPTGWFNTYKLAGVDIRTNNPATGKTIKVQLYDGTTVLQTITWDSDNGQAFNNRVWRVYFPETTLTALQAGSVYRIGFQPQDAAGNWTFSGLTVAANADWAAYPLGTDWYYSHRSDGGAWTDVTTTRLNCRLLLSDLDGSGSHFVG